MIGCTSILCQYLRPGFSKCQPSGFRAIQRRSKLRGFLLKITLAASHDVDAEYWRTNTGNIFAVIIKADSAAFKKIMPLENSYLCGNQTTGIPTKS